MNFLKITLIENSRNGCNLNIYDRKAKDFYEKIVEEVRLGEKAELKSPDSLVFWLREGINN